MMPYRVMEMPFRRSRMSLRPINSFKHVVDSSGALAPAAESVTPICQEDPGGRSTTVPVNVAIGSKVSSLFLSIFVLGTSGSDSGLVDWYIWKNPRGSIPGGSRPIPGNTGLANTRNYIMHEEKGLAATQDGTPMVFKGVIKIPRHFQRIAQGDIFEVVILAPVAKDFCIKAIYKNYI